MLNRVILFSSGQDSSLSFSFLLFQKQRNQLSLLTINHGSQINSFKNLSHSLVLTYVFQQNHFSIFLKFQKNEFNEDFLRFFRYLLLLRLQTFYSVLFFLSGHTESDLFETYFLNWIRTFYLPQKTLFFSNKILIQKTYYRELNTKFFKISFSPVKIKKKLKVSYNFSLNKKLQTVFTRPLKFYSRSSLQKVIKKIPVYSFIDLTNFDFSITRNKIRRHILLYLDTFFFRDLFSFPLKQNHFFLLLSGQLNAFERHVYLNKSFLFEKNIISKDCVSESSILAVLNFYQSFNICEKSFYYSKNELVFVFLLKTIIIFVE